MFWMILLLILMTGVALFAVQNSASVTISFILWRFEASLAIVIFLSIITGAVMSAIVYMITSLRKSFKRDKQTTATAETEIVQDISNEKKTPEDSLFEADTQKRDSEPNKQ